MAIYYLSSLRKKKITRECGTNWHTFQFIYNYQISIYEIIQKKTTDNFKGHVKFHFKY